MIISLKIKIWIPLLAAQALIVSLAFGADKTTEPTYDTFETRLIESVQKHTLKNGLRLITVKRSKTPTVALYIRFKVGSADEEYNNTGTAHLLEHMLFKGTDKIGTRNWQKEKEILKEIDLYGETLDYARLHNYPKSVILGLKEKLQELQKAHKPLVEDEIYDVIYNRNGGVGFNASTSADITTYQISLPKNRLEVWAYIESERLRNPIFREYYLERDVVKEERRMRLDSTGSGLLFENFLATAYQAHAYRHPIIGWMSTLNFLSKKKTVEFFRNHYVPNNMVITAVGDIDHEEFLHLIRKYFENLPRGPEPTDSPTREPAQQGERRVTVEHHDTPNLIIGYHKPNMPRREDYIFDIIEQLLSYGRTSLMYRELVIERQLASSIQSYSSWPGSRYPNLFIIFGAPRKPHTTGELEKAVYQTLDKFMAQPISSEDLQKVKNQMEASFIYGLRSNEGLASSLSYYEILTSDWKYLLKYRRIIATIKEDEIKNTVKKYLSAKNRTVAILKNKKNSKAKKR
jgi:predicted Zn-dependent peptidase